MIELKNDKLCIRFPEVHPDAVLHVELQRTLRIPDDGRSYPLPPGLGAFPLQHVDDYADRVDPGWLQRGGIMLPMYQAEALWMRFLNPTPYPFAVKVAAGKINAVDGSTWSDALSPGQDYLVTPGQPWLDGFCVGAGEVKQFVAMPLGQGYTAEEQITKKAEFGGLQLVAYPMRADVYEARIKPPPRPRAAAPGGSAKVTLGAASMPPPAAQAVAFGDDDFDGLDGMVECESDGFAQRAPTGGIDLDVRDKAASMGLAPGGSMKQAVEVDPHGYEVWDQRHKSRCFLHLCNSALWRKITGSPPPHLPPTAKRYSDAGLPWFEHYSDGPAKGGAQVLSNLQSVSQMGAQKGAAPLPENQSARPQKIVKLREGLAPGEVRDGEF